MVQTLWHVSDTYTTQIHHRQFHLFYTLLYSNTLPDFSSLSVELLVATVYSCTPTQIRGSSDINTALGDETCPQAAMLHVCSSDVVSSVFTGRDRRGGHNNYYSTKNVTFDLVRENFFHHKPFSDHSQSASRFSSSFSSCREPWRPSFRRNSSGCRGRSVTSCRTGRRRSEVTACPGRRPHTKPCQRRTKKKDGRNLEGREAEVERLYMNISKTVIWLFNGRIL